MRIEHIPELMTNIAADIDSLLDTNPPNATLLLADAILSQLAGDFESFFHLQQLKIARRVNANCDAELDANRGMWTVAK